MYEPAQPSLRPARLFDIAEASERVGQRRTCGVDGARAACRGRSVQGIFRDRWVNHG